MPTPDTRPYPQSQTSSFTARAEDLNQTFGQTHSFPTTVSMPMSLPESLPASLPPDKLPPE